MCVRDTGVVGGVVNDADRIITIKIFSSFQTRLVDGRNVVAHVIAGVGRTDQRWVVHRASVVRARVGATRAAVSDVCDSATAAFQKQNFKNLTLKCKLVHVVAVHASRRGFDLFINDENLFINHDDEFTDDATSAKGVESLDDAGFCEWKRFGDSRGDSPGDVFSGEVS